VGDNCDDLIPVGDRILMLTCSVFDYLVPDSWDTLLCPLQWEYVSLVLKTIQDPQENMYQQSPTAYRFMHGTTVHLDA
jgi:hypothetical protein